MDAVMTPDEGDGGCILWKRTEQKIIQVYGPTPRVCRKLTKILTDALNDGLEHYDLSLIEAIGQLKTIEEICADEKIL